MRTHIFQDLMRHRIHDVVLVSSLYDSFILAEDGQLAESVLGEALELQLHNPPRLTHVSSGVDALAVVHEHPFNNLIIASRQLADMDVLALARRVRQSGVDAPIVLLGYDFRELQRFVARADTSLLDGVFLWQGDVRILLAIVRAVEDRRNLAHDVGSCGVQAIIVIEDNIRYYSSFLPLLYAEVIHQAHQLVPEGVNLAHKLMRLQARPKIVLCRTFEEAWSCFTAFQENVLGVISDIEFPKDGRSAPHAGVEFANLIRTLQPDVPVMLQSSQPRNEALARAAGAGFTLKGSPTLLHELRAFIFEHFGFGDFVFRRPDGSEIGRAADLRELEEKLCDVPAESLQYHAERNHFSRWLKARTEFALAHDLRPRTVADFGGVENLRRELMRAIHEYRRERRRATIADFDRAGVDTSGGLSRIGGGSIGGKARGLAFASYLLDLHQIHKRFGGVDIAVPGSVVLGTDAFDAFLDANDLRDFALNTHDEAEIARRFDAADLPETVTRDLAALVTAIRDPMAVRSSSLLEDSQYQPFAGVYDTFMLANNAADDGARLRQLVAAIKRVYASTFSHRAKAYLASTPYRLEEEKMAVILQPLVGAVHGRLFYPDFAGVARSCNFYPLAPMAREDGIAAVAVGLGEAVVDGDACVRFCPKFPKHVMPFSTPRDVLQNSQRQFYALPLDAADGDDGAASALRVCPLEVAERDGVLVSVASTYSAENDALYDGLSRRGVPIVTFAPVLKHGVFPLAAILEALLAVGSNAASGPVEIEFAVDLSSRPARFAFLQLRPLALTRESDEIDVEAHDAARVLCRSASVLGHGSVDTIRDVVVVDYKRVSRGRGQDVVGQVARLNATLTARDAPYLLVGVGRWGSREPYLGIPVTWDQISGARAIVEAGFQDFKVTPSQGTHFFQNLIASNVGYFTVNPESGDGFVDWEWLASQPGETYTTGVRHLSFTTPLTIRMDGRTNRGVVLKPLGT